MLAFAAEALLQILLRDVASVVNVEVVEGEQQVVLGDNSTPICGHRQEFRVVDLAVVIHIHCVKNLSYFVLRHVKPIEGLLDLLDLQRARIVSVKRSEGVCEGSQVEFACVK